MQNAKQTRNGMGRLVLMGAIFFLMVGLIAGCTTINNDEIEKIGIQLTNIETDVTKIKTDVTNIETDVTNLKKADINETPTRDAGSSTSCLDDSVYRVAYNFKNFDPVTALITPSTNQEKKAREAFFNDLHKELADFIRDGFLIRIGPRASASPREFNFILDNAQVMYKGKTHQTYIHEKIKELAERGLPSVPSGLEIPVVCQNKTEPLRQAVVRYDATSGVGESETTCNAVAEFEITVEGIPKINATAHVYWWDGSKVKQGEIQEF